MTSRAAARGGCTAARASILVVEDEEGIQELILEALQAEYEVTQAKTAADAHKVLARETPMLIILDYRLPDRTGLEVLREIRARHPELPVIMMTGYGSELVCLTAFRLGVADYFAKPMNLAALIAAVRRATDSALSRPVSLDSAAALADRCTDDKPAMDVAVQRTALLIQQRYWDRLTLSTAASQLGISEKGLSRRFSQLIGVSFRRYLLEARLERAKHQLLGSHASITEIANAVGFRDLPRFDKLFRRHAGVSPSMYRALRGRMNTKLRCSIGRPSGLP